MSAYKSPETEPAKATVDRDASSAELDLSIPRVITLGAMGCLIGVIAGPILSYWFQAGWVRMEISLPMYLRGLATLPGSSSDLRGPEGEMFMVALKSVVLCCMMAGLLGVAIGAKQDAELLAKAGAKRTEFSKGVRKLGWILIVGVWALVIWIMVDVLSSAFK
jgi:hypothetical protein